MCDPLSIGGLALTAASVGANAIGAGQQSAARDAATSAERQRQAVITQQQQDLFNKTLPQAGGPAQDATRTAAADAQYGRTSAALDTGAAGNAPTGASTTVGKEAVAKAVGDVLQQGKDRARTAADVGGYGDATRRLGVTLGRAGDWQNIYAGNARNSANVLTSELDDANRAGAGMRGIGTLLGAGGQALGMAGIAGKGPSWGSMFGTGAPVSDTIAGPTQQGFFTRMFS